MKFAKNGGRWRREFSCLELPWPAFLPELAGMVFENKRVFS
jgi:hypothetical protein